MEMEYETIGGHQISPIARFIPPYRREEYNRLLWDIQEPRAAGTYIPPPRAGQLTGYTVFKSAFELGH